MSISQTRLDALEELASTLLPLLPAGTDFSRDPDCDYVIRACWPLVGRPVDMSQISREITVRFLPHDLDRYAASIEPTKQIARSVLETLVNHGVLGYSDGREIERRGLKEPHIINVSDTWDF